MEFPYQRFSLTTTKTTDDVALLLIRSIPPNDRSKDPEILEKQEYSGTVWQDSFLIYPNINWDNPLCPLVSRRNPFIPLFRGKLVPTQDGTRIQIQPYPEPVRLIITQWLMAALLAPAILDMLNFLNGRELKYSGIALLFTLFDLGILVVMLRTISEETKRLRNFLNRTVAAKS